MNGQFVKQQAEASAKISEISDRISSIIEIKSSTFTGESHANPKQTSN
jgi:hypothetical protein